MKPAPATTADFNPLATATIGHNQPPATPFDLIKQEIEDLFDEAKNFCDGEAIADEATAAAITELHDRIHAAGSKADKLRVEEKTPLDDAVKAIQAKYAPLISDTKSIRGKVVLGKEACQTLLTPWRTRIAAEKAAEAARIAEEAAEARRKADAAIQSSSGNLAAREEAEAVLAEAKRLERGAKRADKAASTGTGLRTVWDVVLVDEEAALDWAYGRAAAEFRALAQRNAEELVRSGARSVPGFRVEERKVAW